MINKLFFLVISIILIVSCNTNPPTSPENPLSQLGKAYITSNVINAEIWLDNISTGKVTPDTIETTIGTHTITLRKTNYIDVSQTIQIIKDSVVSLIISLTQESGKVFVTSNAAGAQIFIDFVNSGKVTPDTILTTPGIHQISLRRAFFISSTLEVEVFKDSLINLDIVLEEIPPSNVVLLEDFANVSCNPCVISNKIIETLANETYGRNKLVAVKFPTNFPAPNDPFYLAAKSICDARISYYSVFFAPTTVIDGILKPISTDSNSVKSAVDQRLLKELKFRMDVSDNVIGTDYFTTITIKVINGAGLDFSNIVLHTVITETDIEFSTPPGSNGETIFHDVTRTMLPSSAGESLSNISLTDEVVFQRQTNINPGWVVSKLNTVAFIQNVVTKEIYQAGSTFE
ncbi:MAG: PEGA domain-containing protein [Ignavibacteriaceae bacterium]|nr:PEGA domain-containing protein [Ignavibacteriaceae bacterium]